MEYYKLGDKFNENQETPWIWKQNKLIKFQIFKHRKQIYKNVDYDRRKCSHKANNPRCTDSKNHSKSSQTQ
jgi:hypothetical protein